MKNKPDHPKWFFMWATGTPYITMICAWNKEAVIQKAEKEFERTWKQIYACGGRVIQVKIIISEKRSTKPCRPLDLLSMYKYLKTALKCVSGLPIKYFNRLKR